MWDLSKPARWDVSVVRVPWERVSDSVRVVQSQFPCALHQAVVKHGDIEGVVSVVSTGVSVAAASDDQQASLRGFPAVVDECETAQHSDGWAGRGPRDDGRGVHTVRWGKVKVDI